MLVQLDKDISQNVNRMFEKLKEAGKNGFFPRPLSVFTNVSVVVYGSPVGFGRPGG